MYITDLQFKIFSVIMYKEIIILLISYKQMS